ncbi:MAG: DUF2752 domain-containing protein [Sedimentisphaerales bacterium]|nr:DUF2752 domain-containing protein [Sedimentisphaerales bacterium]
MTKRIWSSIIAILCRMVEIVRLSGSWGFPCLFQSRDALAGGLNGAAVVKTPQNIVRYRDSYPKMNQETLVQTETSVPTVAASPRYRLMAALAAATGLFVLMLACYVVPNPLGVGTHTQLGLPACGFYQWTGYPCITCGMTTAFAHVVRGNFIEAFTVQPAGALGALASMAIVIVGVYVCVTGQRIDGITNRLANKFTLLVIGAIVLGAWGWLCLLKFIGVQ